MLFNANDNNPLDGIGGVDEAPGLSFNITTTSSITGDNPKDAFGNNDTAVEGATFLFANSRTPDNGDATMGNGGESVDTLTWATTSVVILDGYRLDVGNDGSPSFNRGTELARFSVEGEADDLFDNNHATGPTDRMFAIPQVGNNFALAVTHTTADGARIREIDAIVTDTSAAVVNETIFNSVNNGVGEDAPGLSTGFTRSSARSGTSDVEAAFGGTGSSPGAATFLFEDLGSGTLSGLSYPTHADNGNNLFGDGVEEVDFIQWSTILPIQLDGYRINLGPDGNVEDANRSTELVRFFVEGVLVDIFDANGHGGAFDRLFASGTLVGDDFRIEFTRHLNGGPRIVEIDALNAQVIAEPSSVVLAGFGLLVLIGVTCRKRWHW